MATHRTAPFSAFWVQCRGVEASSSGLQTEVLLQAAVASSGVGSGVGISLLLLKEAEPCGNPNISNMFSLEKMITTCGYTLQPLLYRFSGALACVSLLSLAAAPPGRRFQQVRNVDYANHGNYKHQHLLYP